MVVWGVGGNLLRRFFLAVVVCDEEGRAQEPPVLCCGGVFWELVVFLFVLNKSLVGASFGFCCFE